MKKKGSLFIGAYSGIKVYIHWTFLILIGWILISYLQAGKDLTGALGGVVFILLLFLCVVLHEFGHALTAKRYGIKTHDISLYPIGGIASLEKLPEKPGQELLVALAGPLVNMVIAIILWIYLSSTGRFPGSEQMSSADYWQNMPMVNKLYFANITLAVFNLIPAFPMDGGRVLRALLAFKMDRTKATRIAAGVGQGLAVVFVFLGFFYNFMLVFIGLFIYLGAGSEALQETVKNALSTFFVRDAMMTRFSSVSPSDSLDSVSNLVLEGQDKEFLVADLNQIHGVLTSSELIKGLSQYGKNATVDQVMRQDYITLPPSMPLQEAYEKLSLSACPVAPVVEGQQLLGLLDKENIHELMMIRQKLA